MIHNWIQEKIVLPISDLIIGQQVNKYLKFVQESKTWSRKQIDAFQNERLRALIKYAYDNVPFYHDEMNSLGLTPEDIQTKEDLSKLPVINKDTIRREGLERFTSKVMPKSQMVMRGSSGSTGQPLIYYSTKLNYSIDIATHLRGWYDFGWRLGDKYIKISQNPRKGIIKNLQDWATRNLYLATADLSDKHIYEMMQQIERYQPKVIRSYPDPLYIMAQYRLAHQGEFTYHPLAITTTGNVLSLQMREIIERAFGCKIYDSYSSEGNANVFECHTHECYHVSEEYGITEVLDEKNNPITSGIGRVITTDLWNYATPFIRYDVQDLVELADKPCSCGRAHMAIKRILGRDNELLVAASGRRYTVHHFTVFFEPTISPQLKDSIEQFQFVQHKDKTTTINLVVNENYDTDVEHYLIEYWSQEFGSKVDIKILERMPIMHNNKRKFIIIEK